MCKTENKNQVIHTVWINDNTGILRFFITGKIGTLIDTCMLSHDPLPFNQKSMLWINLIRSLHYIRIIHFLFFHNFSEGLIFMKL